MRALLVVLLLCAPILAQEQQRLTNQDIINLVKSGLSAEVLLTKIKRSGGSFDTSPAALKQLKEAGISESIIVAMIEADTAKPAISENPVEPVKQTEITLKEGTRVEIELAYTVSSADLKEGDAVSFLVVHPVQIEGFTVIERGAPATARVVKAEGGKSWGRAGQLTWAIQSVTAVDGQKVPLHFTTGTKGDGKGGTVTTGVIVTGLLFWPAAPLWGFKKGKPAVVPAGKRFEVFVHGDISINGQLASRPIVQPAQREAQPMKSDKCYANGRKVPCP
jgi:hypothetical protein